MILSGRLRIVGTMPLYMTRTQPVWQTSCLCLYRDADKSLARPGRKQATATEDFDVRISYLLS